MHFEYNSSLLHHYQTQHHYCLDCHEFFTNAYGLEQHRIQSPRHHYCPPCKREFDSAANLRAHLASSTHKPKDIKCPFYGCNQSFVSQAALILHLEGGKCPSRVDRRRVNDFVRQLDTQNVITNPSRLIGYDSSITLSATESSWNGYMYECYLCHKTFRQLQHLNKHLASPRHQDKIYVCPLSTCRQEFVTLSGLWQHVESEKCGIARFTIVKNTLDGIMNGMKRLSYT